MAKGIFRFLLSAMLVVILLVGMLTITLSFFGLLFKLEVLGLLVLAFVSFVGLTFSRDRLGARFLRMVGLLAAINFVLIGWVGRSMQWFLFAIAILLFVVNIFPQKHRKKNKSTKESMEDVPRDLEHSQVFDPIEDKNSSTQEVITKSTTTKSTTKKLRGRFFASKRSSLYHISKCEWAQKINPQRRVSFKSKEEAWEKGYKAHDCIKN